MANVSLWHRSNRAGIQRRVVYPTAICPFLLVEGLFWLLLVFFPFFWKKVLFFFWMRWIRWCKHWCKTVQVVSLPGLFSSSADIKPENLLISSDDVLKLCDFGEMPLVKFSHSVQLWKKLPNRSSQECFQQQPYLADISVLEEFRQASSGYVKLRMRPSHTAPLAVFAHLN